MSRQTNRINYIRHHTIFETLLRYPGHTAGQITRALGWKPDTVYNALTTMETIGLLLSEDPKGRLYAFAIGDPKPIGNEPPTMIRERE